MSSEKVLPLNLEEIVGDFELCEGREKLELLLDFARSFPDFPDQLHSNFGMEEVPECMTPVHMASEEKEGKLFFYFDIPPESPTVRGFATLMMNGINGCNAEEILRIPSDFYLSMGLQDVLTPQRLNGMAAILAHVQRRAAQSLNS
ncbi:MAG: cysteine desulfuration protein SufE [Chloroflexi bacterium HGW-Chloroflexi-10]|nr:MAG: cysteine desulfuration protein SufE [Chloroflexi bacterium HGW-Chloroflexi-10]